MKEIDVWIWDPWNFLWLFVALIVIAAGWTLGCFLMQRILAVFFPGPKA